MPHERMFHHHHAHKLDDPDRERLLPSAGVVARLDLRPGLHVADVGAGTAYFALPIARAVVPGGRVFAVDMQPEMLEHLRGKLTDEPIALVHGSADATTLAGASVDLVFLANVWHEIDDRPAALAEAKRVLRPGGRVAIVDWNPVDASETDPPGPPAAHRLPAAQAVSDLRAAGLAASDPQAVGPHHYMVIASMN